MMLLGPGFLWRIFYTLKILALSKTLRCVYDTDYSHES